MKDQLFSGRDVTEAVQRASQALGVAPESVRYVVLERGTQAGLGLTGTEARIAVLLERAGAPPAEAGAAPPRLAPSGADERPDASAAVAGALRELVRAGDLAVDVAVEQSAGDTTVQLDGPDAGFFLQDGGLVLSSLEWVLGRIWDQSGERRRLRVRVAGQTDPRETALRTQALALAAAVRQTGQPQQSDPLNAYERRLIHVALAEEPGVRTFSVGEGADRRVTVALADETGPRPEA